MDSSYLYSVLEVPPGCGQKQLRKAYRRQAQKWHPDRHQGSAKVQVLAQKKMQDINIAYATLRKVEREVARRSATCHQKTVPVESPRSPAQYNGPEPEPSSNDVWSPHSRQPPASRDSQQGRFLLGLLGALLFGGYGYFHFIESPHSQRYVLVQPMADPDFALAPTSGERHIRVGSIPRDVLAIQGMPTSVAGNTWFYQDSEIIFGTSGVVKWRNSSLRPLKVK